jgi:hypothetical protein
MQNFNKRSQSPSPFGKTGMPGREFSPIIEIEEKVGMPYCESLAQLQTNCDTNKDFSLANLLHLASDSNLKNSDVDQSFSYLPSVQKATARTDMSLNSEPLILDQFRHSQHMLPRINRSMVHTTKNKFSDYKRDAANLNIMYNRL